MHSVACPGEFSDPFRCPTKIEYLQQLLALLPRGRAWQSHEAATSAIIERFPEAPSECGEAQCGTAQCGQPSIEVSRTVLAAYWAAFAEVNEFFAQRACQLINEFFCETLNETRDWWADDYGFPDPCDPWEALCEKVAAQGGANCAYITWAAERRGWSIQCGDCGSATALAQAGCAFAGAAYPCYDCQPYTINVIIDILGSPAFVTYGNTTLAGNARAGCTVLCNTNTQQVECLIERVKPAHVQAVYSYVRAHKLRAVNLIIEPPEHSAVYLNTDHLEGADLLTAPPIFDSPTLTEL